MKIRHLALAATAFIGLSQVVGVAYAQAKVFVINEDVIRTQSKIGKDIESKLGAIRTEGVSKLGLETLSKEIKDEETALQPQTQSLTKEALAANPTLKARVDALNKKKAEFLQKADFLDQNLGQQSNAAMAAFAAALEPAVNHVAKEAGADIVLSSTSTWYIKNTSDLSAKVVARLDATTPSLDSLKTAANNAAPAKPTP
jgi:Skp family chaperone for outer membrane proteins